MEIQLTVMEVSIVSAFFISEKYSIYCISYLIQILIVLFKMRPNYKAPDLRVRESMRHTTQQTGSLHNESDKLSVRELL